MASFYFKRYSWYLNKLTKEVDKKIPRLYESIPL